VALPAARRQKPAIQEGCDSVREQVEEIQAVAGEFPMIAFLCDQPAARILLIFSVIDRHELKPGLAFDLRGGPGNEFERNAVEVQGNFIPGDSRPG
jgi:hypothetical protein